MKFKIGDIVIVKKGIKTSRHGSYEEGDVGVVNRIIGDLIKVTFNKTSKYKYNRLGYSVDRSEIELDKTVGTKLWEALS